MNLRTVALVTAILNISLGSWSQSFPDLVVDSATETLYMSGDKYFRSVSVIGGATLSYGLLDSDQSAGLQITCGSLLIDERSTISAGLLFTRFDQLGTPDIIIVNEYGETTGNGAGTHGGRGFNAFDQAKPAYGSDSEFSIEPGSKGTAGVTRRIWFGGPLVLPGGDGGLGAAMIRIVGNEMIIEGSITADGLRGDGFPCALWWAGYSGSGGGILIAAKRLTITRTARITANGGEYAIKEPCDIPQNPISYHEELVGKRDGGGGRIKIFYEEGTISPEAVIEAKGWEDGTVHIEQVKSIDQLLNPGDLDGDGVTDHRDLFLLMQSWQKVVTPIPGPAETPSATP